MTERPCSTERTLAKYLHGSSPINRLYIIRDSMGTLACRLCYSDACTFNHRIPSNSAYKNTGRKFFYRVQYDLWSRNRKSHVNQLPAARKSIGSYGRQTRCTLFDNVVDNDGQRPPSVLRSVLKRVGINVPLRPNPSLSFPCRQNPRRKHHRACRGRRHARRRRARRRVGSNLARIPSSL